MSVSEQVRRKRCSRCNELKPADEVLGWQKLCEECEADMSYCTVCDEWEDRCWGDGCRHVGWSDEFGCNAGCGTNDIDAKDHRESFDLLLSKLAPLKAEHFDRRTGQYVLRPLLPSLLSLIAANNFWTTWHGPLIGGPPDLDLRYEKDFGAHKSGLSLYDLRASEQIAWGSEDIRRLQLGVAWLTSLDHASVKANQLTAKWIEEYLVKQGANQ